MSYVTDREHLVKVAEDIIVAVEQVARQWLREDELACAPRSAGEAPTSGGGTSDPTLRVATGRGDGMVDAARYKARDRIGGKLLAIHKQLEAEVKSHQPREAGGACRCCDTETATHGADKDNRPVLCWHCSEFLKRQGFRCGPDVHEGRPEPVKMCQCPSWCCSVCPDRVGEGRTKLSERCAKRVSRGQVERDIA